MVIDKSLLDALSEEARNSERLRMNHDMRTSSSDSSQRMLNALEPGTVLPIHRHRNTSETLIVVRGSVMQRFYDDNGCLIDSFLLSPKSDKIGISVPAGQWHDSVSLEPDTVIFEAKDGHYMPLTEQDILK